MGEGGQRTERNRTREEEEDVRVSEGDLCRS